jgi:hypothetical protein
MTTRSPYLWPSLAISTMWFVVLIDALWGPDIITTSSNGIGKIPSAVVFALFAWLGTLAIAKRAFGREK